MCGIRWKVDYRSKLAQRTMVVILLVFALVGLEAAGTAAGAGEWTSLGNGPDGAQRLFAVAINPFNPKVVYVGAGNGGGLFKSVDGGDSWHSAINGLEGAGKISVNWLATSRTSPHTVLAVVGGGNASLYRSDDGTASWQLVDVNLGPYPLALVTSPLGEGTVYIAGSSWMLRSDDDGRTWNTIDYFTSACYSVGVDPVDPRRVFVGTGQTIHRSDDGGHTWQTIGGSFRAGDFVFDEGPRCHLRG